MSTVAPIDVERYLLQGEGDDELLGGARIKPLPKTQLPAKPPLEDALRAFYNSTAPPDQQLGPGQLPQPVPQPPPEPGILQKTGEAISGAAGTVARIPGQIYESLPSMRGSAQAPPTQAPPSTTTPLSSLIPEPELPGAPKPTTPPGRQYAPGFYGILQRHANFVRDTAEAGGNLIAGAGAFGFGALTAVSDILNSHLSRIARGGIMAGGPESPTHYRDIFQRMDQTIANLTPEPRSDIAKNVGKAVGTVTGLVKDVAELPGKGLVALGVLNEDTARVLSFATELYMFYKLDRGIREAAPELRAKIADFKTRMSRARTDTEAAGVASDLADAAAKNPRLEAALDEARGKFRDEADREAGTPPRGPKPPDEGPAGGGEAIHPDDLRAYSDALARRADELKAQGVSFEEMRTELGNVPKPQPRDALAEVSRLHSALQTNDIVAQSNAMQELRSRVQPGETLENSLRRAGVSESVVADIVRVDRELEARYRAGFDPEDVVMDVDAIAAEHRRAQQERAQSQAQRPAAEPTRPEYQDPRQRIMDAYPRLQDADPAVRQAALQQIRDATVIGESLERSLDRWGISPQISANIQSLAGKIDAERAQPTPQPQAQRAAPAPEAQRAAPTAERPVQPEVVVRGETAVAPVTRPPEVPAARPTTEIETTTQRVPEAAATVAPETAPAPVSPEIPAVAAVTPEIPLPGRAAEGYRAPAFAAIEAIRDENTSPADRKTSLQNLKREALNLVPQSVERGLRQLGIDEETIAELVPQLRKIRAAKAGTETLQQVAEKPAVQQAATEAVLENAPAGTEVEIPAPTEPVVDTSPVVEKPKRKRRVVKAKTDEQVAREQYAEGEVALARGERQQQENQRTLIEQQLGTRVSLDEAERILKSAFDRGMRPNEAWELLSDRVNPQAALDATNIAYDLYVHGNTINRPPVTMRGGNVGYSEISTIAGLDQSAKATTLPSIHTDPVSTPIQVRTAGGRPDAIFIDTRGMSSRTSLADIERQVQRGQTSPEIAQALRAGLQRQADIAGLPIEQANQFTGQELTREATRVAAENDLDLYVKKGKNYELVPKDVVRADARLNRGDNLAPTPISAETAGAYVESKTSPIGPEQIREILTAIEQGVDITDRLPSELIPHYQQMRESERAGIDTSERRAFIDILTDFNTMLGEQGAIGANWTRAQRMAAQRLQADLRKAGKDVREFLFGARPEDVGMFEEYLNRINNPTPPDSTNPRNMRFDPENIIPGDRVVKQRVISKANGTNAVPLWQSEVRGIQGARDIKPGGTDWDVKLPLRQHKQAGTEFLYYGYRTAQKNLNAELNDLHAGMEELSRGFSSRSLENIGANGYQRQGGDGQRILTYNKVTPRPLTAAERRLQATIDGIYADLFNRINETRVATGREPLGRVDDYQTFARTISLLNRLGIKVDLARDSVAEINSAYVHHKATNFPYVVRKHAFYTAEMNALKILDTYAQSALKDIHLSPFLAKMHELIETNLPDPVTSKETWKLKENKPGLYNELRRWTDYLATGTNRDIPDTQRIILQTLNSNIAYSTLSYLVRSAGIQVSTLINTRQALGTVATARSILESFAGRIAHPVTGGKQREFALANSEILSSRKFIDAYNQVAGAIIGRRPRDFFHAIRVGDFSSIQQAAGNPGFKLMELFDMEAAAMSWNAAYKQARSRAMSYSHKDAVRFADDLVVRTQGSTMPGDLSGVQRNALGKLVTQFQTFLISDWNFLTQEVLTKGKIGGGGGGQIPPGGVASGSGSWEEPGAPRSTFQLVKNVVGFLIATQLVNEFFKMLHIQPAQPDPVEDVRKGVAAKHGAWQLALDLVIGQAERLPFVGGMRYGKGIAGPAIETARDLGRSYRGDPLSPPWWEPTATMTGVPGVRQTSKFVRAQKRGESPYDSLVGWYSQEQSGRRERGERRERTR